MKLSIALVILAGSSTALAKDAPPAAITSFPGYDEPARPWTDVEYAAGRQRCRDRIEQARAASGQPELDRSPAGEEQPLLHYAIDRRIDGCGVLVPVSDPADIREPPASGTRIPTRRSSAIIGSPSG